ncbi:MAG: LuxR C-terminal-related transcriptional regulator [Ktedonobacterales bacterium]
MTQQFSQAWLPAPVPPGDSRHMLPARRYADLDRLAPLLPQAERTGVRDPLAFALEYVEHYADDVPQLEQEWEFLSATLMRAWQRERYAAVVRLVAGLAPLAGRIVNPIEAQRLLRLGIAASRHTGETLRHAAFTNRLGMLLFTHGKHRRGWRLWRTSLESVGAGVSAETAFALGDPLASFASIADLVGYAGAWPLVESLACAPRHTDPDVHAVVRFLKGFRALRLDDTVRACGELGSALRLLARQPSGAPRSALRQVLKMVIQAEMASLRGDRIRARSATESAFTLATVYSDRYTRAVLLIDDGLFALRDGDTARMHAIYLRLREASRQAHALPVYQSSCRFFERQLAAAALAAPGAAGSDDAPLPCAEPLSAREREVLLLVATGLSNRDIAVRLVVTVATVKKHLEHIYAKLDTHSRTAAAVRARALDLIP